MEIDERLALLFRERRLANGLTQADLAEIAEVSRRSVVRLESTGEQTHAATARRVGVHLFNSEEMDIVSALAAGKAPKLQRGDLDLVEEELDAGYFERARLPVLALETEAALHQTSPQTTARVYRAASILAEEQDRLPLALRYANLGLQAAKESNNLNMTLVAQIQRAAVVSRYYDDASSLRMMQRMDPEQMPERQSAVLRDVYECVFGYWSGEEPDLPTLYRAANVIADDPRHWARELAFLMQGLEAGLLGINVFPTWMVDRTIVRASAGQDVLDEFRKAREIVFPSASPYANLLDLLNRINESIQEQRPEAEIRILLRQALGLAAEVGASRLWKIFKWKIEGLPTAIAWASDN